MASQGYRDYVAAGRPYTLIRPAAAVQATLRGHGLTVYDKPNQAHLEANTPEDHTPFSVTGWPGPNKRWKARALDVMPRSDSAAHRKENADVARQLIRDRDAGVPGAMWIKYLNWTDENGNCQQVRWTDGAHPLQHTTKVSSDAGHIHISGRSDVDDDERADTYDPIARMGGATGDDEMSENDSRRLAALFDMQDLVVLFTDGTGTRDPKGFGVPVVAAIRRLEAAAAADAQRDAAATVAIQALATVLQSAGGSVEAAPIIAAVRAVGDQVHADVEQLQQRLAAAEARNVQLAAALAAAGAQLQAADDPAA